MLRFETSHGDFTIELFEEAPRTVANFLKYVEDGFYDGTIFHRVVPGFVIQGGGMEPGPTQKPTRPPIQNEATNGLENLRGTLSMARTSDIHSAPRSSSSTSPTTTSSTIAPATTATRCSAASPRAWT